MLELLLNVRLQLVQLDLSFLLEDGAAERSGEAEDQTTQADL